MDLPAVLAAVRTIRERLANAIDFSTGHFNMAGWHGPHFDVPGDRTADEFWEAAAGKHRAWRDEVAAAYRALTAADYPPSPDWWLANLDTPQVAFCVDRDERTWVIGAGENACGETVPVDCAGTLRAGDTIENAYADEYSGIFDRSIVAEWERIYAELLVEERRLTIAVASDHPTAETFVPSPLQQAILEALDCRALKKDALAAVACGGDGSRLYKRNGIAKLRELGRVDHKHTIGYYRPDAPPHLGATN